MSDNTMTSEEKENKIEVAPKDRVLKKAVPKRDGRVPLHKQNRIGIDKEPGYHYRLVTDRDNGERIERFKRAGYEIVTGIDQPDGKNAQDPSQMGTVTRKSVGRGDIAYYMRIPQELFDEDQRDKQKRNDQIMKQIKDGFTKDRPIKNMRGSVSYDETLVDE